MIQQQTSRHSGSTYHFNLDDNTLAALYGCQQTFISSGQCFSNSVIVRRALRAFLEKLETMPERVMEQEVVQTKRAAKGVL